ncbi:MAG: hypothetical protein CMQ19_07715 [Gammaproteobacteria bacterium]|nr:hypothetical protein [Gammaproteobacteria bacterium]
MTLALGIIDINDAGIQVAIDNEIVSTSPGFAVMDGDHLLVGNEALHNARLLPSWTNNRFWNQLNTDPIANSTDDVRHHADLAFAHLESLWQPLKKDVDRVILLVPGYFAHPQLGLLLGMATECGIPVSGVADSSLLAACDLPISQDCLHLDIHLHRTTLTRLTSSNTLNRKDATTITETGVFTLWDRWANIIADQFIQTSRFDPMHHATSEQALFNQLPDWIDQLGASRGNTFELNLGDVNHSISISSDQLMGACAQIYPQLVQFIRTQVADSEFSTLLLSHRFSGFPGLKDSLGLITNIELVEVEPSQTISSAYTHAEKIFSTDGAINHITNLQVRHQQQKPKPTQNRSRATHMLMGNHAVAIGKSFQLSRDLTDGIRRNNENPICTLYVRGDALFVDSHTEEDLAINGETADRETILKPGDSLKLGEQIITLISVT